MTNVTIVHDKKALVEERRIEGVIYDEMSWTGILQSVVFKQGQFDH